MSDYTNMSLGDRMLVDSYTKPLHHEIDQLRAQVGESRIYAQGLQSKLTQAEVEIERLKQVPIKWSEDCYNRGYEAAEKARAPDTSQLSRYRGALEQIANLPRCGDVRCRPLPENIARAALADAEKESTR